jgi:hypothetical protein
MAPHFTVLTTISVMVFVLGWLWFGPLTSLRRDNFRSDIRRIRDDLFDFMWMNGYSYDCASYQKVRMTLNGMLSLSNQVNPVWFVVWSRQKETINRDVTFIDDGDDAAVRQYAEQALKKAARRLEKFAFTEGTWGVAVRLLTLFSKLERARHWAAVQCYEWIKGAYVFESVETRRLNSGSSAPCLVHVPK